MEERRRPGQTLEGGRAGTGGRRPAGCHQASGLRQAEMGAELASAGCLRLPTYALCSFIRPLIYSPKKLR